MLITSKRGAKDNIVTYEHFCDTTADLDKIPKEQITLGSTAIVLKDEDDGLSVYIANSNKEWISFSNTGTGGGSMATLASLLDMNISNPTDGQTLIYNGETEKWENGENEIVLEVTTTYDETTDDYIYSIDKTYHEIRNLIENSKKNVLLHVIEGDDPYLYGLYTFDRMLGSGIYFYRIFPPYFVDNPVTLGIATICIKTPPNSDDVIPSIQKDFWSINVNADD